MTNDHLTTLASAIAKEEGASVAGSRPWRNNNPGDLRNWPGVPTDGDGFSVFPSLEDGWNALLEDIRNHAAKYPNQTLLQFIAGDGKGWPGYAPASDSNNPVSYAVRLSDALNCSATKTTFAEL